MRVASAAEGAVFEVIAAPQEQPTQAQEERCEHPAQGPSDPALSNSHKASPGAHPINLNYDTYICIYYLCITFEELIWNPSCMNPKFP